MDEFTQAQAAILSGYDERAFRTLVERRIVLPTPATRITGRGKAKIFDRSEVRVASVLQRIGQGLDPHALSLIADLLRKGLDLALRQHSAERPVYVFLDMGTPAHDGSVSFRPAQRIRNEMIVSITATEGGCASALFRGVNVFIALWWDQKSPDELRDLLEQAESKGAVA